MLAQGQTLELPPPPALKTDAKASKATPIKSAQELLLDDQVAELEGTWIRSTHFKPYIGTGYVHDEQRSDGKSRATFRFKGPTDGEFALRMTYSAHETRTKRLPIIIAGDGQEQRLTVDQTVPLPAGEAFRTVGQVRLRKGVDYTLTLSNTGTEGFVILDAFQLIPAAAATATPR